MLKDVDQDLDGAGGEATSGQVSGRDVWPREVDLICLSHLRWDFVFQRPQHLLSRCARDRRVVFVEEPVEEEGVARLELGQREGGVWVATPRRAPGRDPHDGALSCQPGVRNVSSPEAGA